ncbi:MAG TPA: hypothetical protein PL135_10090, partial [Spirochaetota bacterium]|nr:hypothetical protein [Spirochaetota bacterium]
GAPLRGTPALGAGTVYLAYALAPAHTPQLITNFTEFTHSFGEVATRVDANSALGHAVRGYFLNGGTRAWVTRVGSLVASDSSDPIDAALTALESIDEVADIVTDETVRRNLLTVRSFIFRLAVTGRVNKTEVTMIALYNRQNRVFYYMSEQ